MVFTRRSGVWWRGCRRSKRLRQRRERGGDRTNDSSCDRCGLRRADEADFHRHADQVLDLNLVTWLDVAGDGFGTNPRIVDLAVGVVYVGEKYVPRHLPVNADRLDSFQYAVSSSFKHSSPKYSTQRTRASRKQLESAWPGSTVSATSSEVTKRHQDAPSPKGSRSDGSTRSASTQKLCTLTPSSRTGRCPASVFSSN